MALSDTVGSWAGELKKKMHTPGTKESLAGFAASQHAKYHGDKKSEMAHKMENKSKAHAAASMSIADRAKMISDSHHKPLNDAERKSSGYGKRLDAQKLKSRESHDYQSRIGRAYND